MTPKMKIPKKLICEILSYGRICQVDKAGFGSCGDGVVHDDGGLCLWAGKVIEWQGLPAEVRYE